MTYNKSYHFFLWPGFGWIWRSAWWAFVGTSCLWLEYGIFSNSIKISDPNIQYPARSHLFRSFPGCFWGSIIFNKSQSQGAQIPRTLSPSLGYFKSLNIRALVLFDQTLGKKKLPKKWLGCDTSNVGDWNCLLTTNHALRIITQISCFQHEKWRESDLNPWTPSPPNLLSSSSRLCFKLGNSLGLPILRPATTAASLGCRSSHMTSIRSQPTSCRIKSHQVGWWLHMLYMLFANGI